MLKKDPIYRVTIYKQDKTITVEYPLTCHFNVTRGVLSDASKCTIQLYNLAPSTRNEIFQDAWTNFLSWQEMKYIHLEAGWNGSMSMIFKGRIMQAYSYKSGGQTDVITEIQAQALDIFDCPTSHTFLEGTSYKDVLKNIAADMPNVQIGNIGNLEGTLKTPTTFEGNALDELNKLTGGHTFVDNGLLNTIMSNEVIEVPVPVITDNDTLLETPRRRDANLEVKMLFHPDLIVNQLLEIQSGIFPDFNGQYKVVSFTHDCLISGTQAGQRITTVNLWIGPFLPGANVAVTGEQNTTQFNKVKGEEVSPVNEAQPSSIKDVYNYIQKNNGKIPNTKITRNISWVEMLGNDNTDAARKSEVSMAVLTNVYNTAHTLQNFLNTFYPGRTVTITSGWRSTANNQSCGGNPKSKHLYGLAVDFNVTGVSVKDLISKLKGAWNGYVQSYPAKKMCHAQLNAGKGRVNDV